MRSRRWSRPSCSWRIEVSGVREDCCRWVVGDPGWLGNWAHTRRRTRDEFPNMSVDIAARTGCDELGLTEPLRLVESLPRHL